MFSIRKLQTQHPSVVSTIKYLSHQFFTAPFRKQKRDHSFYEPRINLYKKQALFIKTRHCKKNANIFCMLHKDRFKNQQNVN